MKIVEETSVHPELGALLVQVIKVHNSLLFEYQRAYPSKSNLIIIRKQLDFIILNITNIFDRNIPK